MRKARNYCPISLLMAPFLCPACGESLDRRDGFEDGGIGAGAETGDEDDGGTDDGGNDGGGGDDGSTSGGGGSGNDGGGDDGDDGGGTDGGNSDGSGSDGGTDCHDDVDWGNAGAGSTPIDQDIGQVIANWSHTGYIDQDGDGIVEPELVPFTMEDVHCTGKRSMLVLMGDTY